MRVTVSPREGTAILLRGGCWLQDIEKAVCEGDEARARDILERLEHEVELEARQ